MSEVITGELTGSTELTNESKVSERSTSLETKTDSSLKRTASKLGRIAAATTLGFLGGSYAMNQFGQTAESVGPVSIDVGLKVDYESFKIGDAPIPYPTLDGGSKLEGNLLGSATADTHDFGPMLSVEPTGIDVSHVENVVMAGVGMRATGGRGLDTVSNNIEADLQRLEDEQLWIALRSLGTFLAGAGLTQLLIRMKNYSNKERVAAAVASGSTMLAGIGGIWADFDQRALSEPRLHGLAAEAMPYAMSVSRLDALDENAMKTIDGFWAFQSIISQQVEQQEHIPPTAARIMVVSDIHSRNVYPMIKQFVDNNEIDAVVDLGDLTDWGSTPEDNFATEPRSALRDLTIGIKDLGVPYFFLPGNHDSASTERAVAELKNTTSVRKGDVRMANIEGMRVMMAGDPLFTPDKSTLEDAEAEMLRDQLRDDISEAVDKQTAAGQPVDWLITHQPAITEGLDVEVPFTSAGHKHYYKLTYDEDSGTWHHQEGSTGGSGLRMAQPEEGDTNMPEPDRQSFSIINVAEDCQVTKLEHFSFNIFDNKESEYFVEINDQLHDEGEARCGDPEMETPKSPQGNGNVEQAALIQD